MNIGFDLTVQEEQPTGVARLQLSLLEGLSRVDGDHTYTLYSREPVRLPLALGERFRFRSAGRKMTPRRFRAKVLPRLIREDGLDLFHSPVVAIPYRGPGYRVATAHDFPWLHPETAKEGGAIRKTFAIGRTLRRAARVLVPSEFTRQDLAGLMPRFAGKVRVSRPGILRPFFERERSLEITRAVGERLGLPRPPYLLAVGSVRRRKNIDVLLRMVARVTELAGEATDRLPPLVIAGASEDSPARLLAHVREEHGLGPDQVVFTGYVDEEDLIPVYDGAVCFLFPTRLEGFGFPPLEALARGVPVVASPSGAVPEVLGEESALFVGTGDVDGWVAAVIKLLSEKETRESLAAAGQKRARTYDGEGFARDVLGVYAEIVEEGAGTP